MKIIKQKRNQKGQYKRKHTETIKHLIAFCLVVWVVNIIEYKNLPDNKLYITGNGAPLVITPSQETGDQLPASSSTSQEARTMPEHTLSAPPEPAEDGGMVIINSKASSDSAGTPNRYDSPKTARNSDVPVNASAIEGKIREMFPEDPDTAVALFRSESGLNPNAKGDLPLEYEYQGRIIGHSCGIAQIRVLPGRPDCETLKDVDENLKFARHLYEKNGWYPWSNFKNNRYLKYL